MDKITRDAHVEHYYPSVVAPAAEFKALAVMENPELCALWELFWRHFANTFVYEIDEKGAVRWEDMLNLHPLPTDSLSVRKKRILLKINATLPYTFRSFQNMFDGAFDEGNAVESLNANQYALWIDLAGTMILRQEEIRRFARVIVPANLSIHISNQKTAAVAQYVGAALSIGHILTIEASLSCEMAGDYPATGYYAAVIYESKQITIGGTQ